MNTAKLTLCRIENNDKSIPQGILISAFFLETNHDMIVMFIELQRNWNFVILDQIHRIKLLFLQLTEHEMSHFPVDKYQQ